MIRALLFASLVTLTSCATTTVSPPASSSPSAGCDAASVQGRVGQIVPAGSGARELTTELLRLTAARTLRWIAPGMAVTMDFRPDRLSVSYDEQRTITQITCG